MMKPPPRTLRCAVYTRVSTDYGLEQDFNSLDAPREAAAAAAAMGGSSGAEPTKPQTASGKTFTPRSFTMLSLRP
jgi:hypothetical protein